MTFILPTTTLGKTYKVEKMKNKKQPNSRNILIPKKGTDIKWSDNKIIIKNTY